MGWNQEKHLQYGLMFDDGCITQGIPDNKSKDSTDISECKSCQNCGDIANVLPNDPFDMMFTMVSPKEAFKNDISISLPKDPFGSDFKTSDHLNMDLNIEATVAAITDWIVDFVLEADELEYEKAFEYKNIDDYEILTELHFVWTGLLKPEEEDNEMSEARNVGHEDIDMSGGEAQELCFGCYICQNELVKDDARDDVCAPADALYLALGHLSITDLLNVEGVCKSMRDAVRNDTLLWQNIEIDSSLNLKMTDERLMLLTDRAKGSLRSLNLFNCFNITNVGLRHVMERNLRLTKLDVAGCQKVKAEGLLQDLKSFNTINSPGIKYLRAGELEGLTNQHVNEFQGLLGVNHDKYIPRYHFFDQLYLSLDNERALDVETCPKCKKPKQVFDCTSPRCKGKIHSRNECKGCAQCIARCIRCGCCLGDEPYEETFFFDFRCADCCYTHHLPAENYENVQAISDSCG